MHHNMLPAQALTRAVWIYQVQGRIAAVQSISRRPVHDSSYTLGRCFWCWSQDTAVFQTSWCLAGINLSFTRETWPKDDQVTRILKNSVKHGKKRNTEQIQVTFSSYYEMYIHFFIVFLFYISQCVLWRWKINRNVLNFPKYLNVCLCILWSRHTNE